MVKMRLLICHFLLLGYDRVCVVAIRKFAFFGVCNFGCTHFFALEVKLLSCCVFFGHKDVDPTIRENLKRQIETLIIENNVTEFYVGNNGGFDYMVYDLLKELKEQYTNIMFSVALAYIPAERGEFYYSYYKEEESFVPDGVECGPIRFAIDRRNKWLVEQADFVITHVKHSWGGAAKFKEIAEKKKKQVINII